MHIAISHQTYVSASFPQVMLSSLRTAFLSKHNRSILVSCVCRFLPLLLPENKLSSISSSGTVPH